MTELEQGLLDCVSESFSTLANGNLVVLTILFALVVIVGIILFLLVEIRKDIEVIGGMIDEIRESQGQENEAMQQAEHHIEELFREYEIRQSL